MHTTMFTGLGRPTATVVLLVNYARANIVGLGVMAWVAYSVVVAVVVAVVTLCALESYDHQIWTRDRSR